MRILMVRISGGISGAEIYNLNLLKGFRKYKDVDICFLTNLKELSERVLKIGHKSVLIKPSILEIGTKKDFLKALVFSPLFLIEYIKTIRSLEKEEKFDLIILQSMTEKIFLTHVLRLLFRYRVLWIEHGPLFVTNRAKIIKLLYAFSSQFADKIIAVSKNTEEDLRKGEVGQNKIKTLYTGVNTEEFAISEVQNSKNNVTVGFLGTVCKEKGIIEFFEISKILIKKDKKFKFLIIGDGEMLSWLKEKVKNTEVSENYKFTGFVEDVKNYLSLMDVFLFPTKHFEGLSNAVLEAMSMGIPVVATDIGGNFEIIKNGFNGYIYRINEKANKVAQLIIEVCKNKKGFSQNARTSIVQNFNMEKNIKKFYEVFNSYSNI